MPIQPDDILLNKASIIERCVRRIKEEHDLNRALDNFTHIDAMTLNIERACQAAIDMAMHVVAVKRLGVPQSAADAFLKLEENGIIPPNIRTKLKGMTGFRNIAIHEYQKMNLDILRAVAEGGYGVLIEFCRHLGIKITAGVQQ